MFSKQTFVPLLEKIVKCFQNKPDDSENKKSPLETFLDICTMHGVSHFHRASGEYHFVVFHLCLAPECINILILHFEAFVSQRGRSSEMLVWWRHFHLFRNPQESCLVYHIDFCVCHDSLPGIPRRRVVRLTSGQCYLGRNFKDILKMSLERVTWTF